MGKIKGHRKSELSHKFKHRATIEMWPRAERGITSWKDVPKKNNERDGHQGVDNHEG